MQDCNQVQVLPDRLWYLLALLRQTHWSAGVSAYLAPSVPWSKTGIDIETDCG
jgi:hypothetical protein